MAKKYALYAILIILLIVLNIRIEHIQDEDVELWDVYIGRYTITYTYDAIEGPVFWLSDDGLTLGRWPSYKPRPRLTPNWA